MATNNATNVATAATGTVLQGQGEGTAPTFSTATYPATATGTGTLLRANGTNWSASTSTYPNTNAINTLLYASSANVMAALATANGGVLATSSSGVPSIDTTNFAVLSTGLQLKGNNTNTAPPAGFIGEQISSFVGAGSAVSVSDNTATNIASISLTAGVWNVACILMWGAAAITGTVFETSISQTSATRGTLGDNNIQNPTAPTAVVNSTMVIPQYRIILSSTTTIYMVAFSRYTVGALTAYGRISATRVG